MNFIKFIELNFLIICVFFFIFSLFVIFSIFKEWMAITKVITFVLLNSLSIGILIMKFEMQIEKILNIPNDKIFLIYVCFTALLAVVLLILKVIENERFLNKLKKMWFKLTSFILLYRLKTNVVIIFIIKIFTISFKFFNI